MKTASKTDIRVLDAVFMYLWLSGDGVCQNSLEKWKRILGKSFCAIWRT